MKRVSIEIIAESYKRLKNVWEVAKEVGLCGQTVHQRLTRAGLMEKMNVFTEEDKELLRSEYLTYREAANLKALAERMGRTVPFICRQAKLLGLTDRENRVSMKPFAEETSKQMKKRLEEKGHPRGMKGKSHTDEFKAKMSERVKKNWADPNSALNSEEFRQKKSDNMSRWQNSRSDRSHNYSRTKDGYWSDGERRIYMRSKWEMNYAFYLNFLVKNKEIMSWEYEADTFWFEKIKRGVRSYKPDFKVTDKNGAIEYHEVKGWLDAKSQTKLKRMKIYYPKVKLILIHEKEYKAIKKIKNLIPGWID